MKSMTGERNKSRFIKGKNGIQIYVDVSNKNQNKRNKPLENKRSVSLESNSHKEMDDISKRADMIKICKRELLHRINGVSFGKNFRNELNVLFADKQFIEKINIIKNQNKEIELAEDYRNPAFLDFKKRILPNMMFELKLDSNPTLADICNKTAEAGLTKLSAKITVYYLIRMLQIAEPYLEEQSVAGLAKAMKKLDVGE